MAHIASALSTAIFKNGWNQNSHDLSNVVDGKDLVAKNYRPTEIQQLFFNSYTSIYTDVATKTQAQL